MYKIESISEVSRGRGPDSKGQHKETFLTDEAVLYSDCDGK